MKMLIPSSLSLALLLTIASCVARMPSAVVYEVTNKAIGTPGGERFDCEIGVDQTRKVLADATSFIWTTFNQPNYGDYKNVQLITCIIESMDGIAYTNGSSIHVSAQYIENFKGDVETEITGVLYHETTHVWQWYGHGQAPSGLIEGVADYVRLKAGYEPLDGHWVKPGQGDRWDEGYAVTARFLDYCAGFDSEFVAKLNAKMKDGYCDDFFVELLGKTVNQLFSDYKAAFAYALAPQ